MTPTTAIWRLSLCRRGLSSSVSMATAPPGTTRPQWSKRGRPSRGPEAGSRWRGESFSDTERVVRGTGMRATPARCSPGSADRRDWQSWEPSCSPGTGAGARTPHPEHRDPILSPRVCDVVQPPARSPFGTAQPGAHLEGQHNQVQAVGLLHEGQQAQLPVCTATEESTWSLFMICQFRKRSAAERLEWARLAWVRPCNPQSCRNGRGASTVTS